MKKAKLKSDSKTIGIYYNNLRDVTNASVKYLLDNGNTFALP